MIDKDIFKMVILGSSLIVFFTKIHTYIRVFLFLKFYILSLILDKICLENTVDYIYLNYIFFHISKEKKTDENHKLKKKKCLYTTNLRGKTVDCRSYYNKIIIFKFCLILFFSIFFFQGNRNLHFQASY